MHEEWAASGGREEIPINSVRREEEQSAMRLLGLEPVWLDLPDAPYRRGAGGETFYNSDLDLFGRVAPEERKLLVPAMARAISRVASEAGARGRVRVYAPLGVGHHVDHQLSFRAARRLGPRFGVMYYEDYPYAGKEGALRARLEELGLPARPRVMPIAEQIGIKIAAINKYKSQLDVLFGSSALMPRSVRAYAELVAATSSPSLQYAERFWHLPPTYTLGV
jgi:LmbE family N-acetylglucosaminyl deacetylase